MNANGTGHLTDEALLSFLDGSMQSGEARSAEEHLGSCPRCTRALASMREFETLVRLLPRERASEQLVRAVLARVGITPRQSLFVRAVGALPYAFALLVAGGVLIAVFTWSGAIDTAGMTSVPGAAGDAVAAAHSGIGKASRWLIQLSSGILPVASGGGLRLGIALAIVLTVVAAFDRLFASKAAQRAR